MTTSTRRAFIGGLVATTLVYACAPAALPRLTPRLRRIGWLSGNATAVVKTRSLPFFQRIGELGYVEGHNFAVEWKFAGGKMDELPKLASELLALPVDVIVAEAADAQLAVCTATTTTPTVLVLVADPFASSCVATAAHPGGNTTGVSTGSIAASEKRVEYLKTTMPGLARLAVVWSGTQPNMIKTLVPATVDAARTLGIAATPFAVRDAAELDMTLERIARDRFDALICLPLETITADRLARIPDFANKIGLPQAYADESIARAGGLMSYNSNRAVQYQRVAEFVDKIFNGALPADIPFEDPTKFDLIINLTAARKLGRTFPPSVVASATEVIQ